MLNVLPHLSLAHSNNSRVHNLVPSSNSQLTLLSRHRDPYNRHLGLYNNQHLDQYSNNRLLALCNNNQLLDQYSSNLHALFNPSLHGQYNSLQIRSKAIAVAVHLSSRAHFKGAVEVVLHNSNQIQFRSVMGIALLNNPIHFNRTVEIALLSNSSSLAITLCLEVSHLELAHRNLRLFKEDRLRMVVRMVVRRILVQHRRRQ